MTRHYADEPHDLCHAARRFFSPLGLLPFVLALLAIPFLRYDDVLTVSPAYATLREIFEAESIWGGLTLALMVAGLVAWWMRSLGMQLLALLLQSGFFLLLASAVLRSSPHSLGVAVYGGLGVYGLLYAAYLVREAARAPLSRGE